MQPQPNAQTTTQPNRYNTIVGVSLYYEDHEYMSTNWFQDLQSAWKWVEEQVSVCTEGETFTMQSFLRCANKLDQAWRQSTENTGICMAKGGEHVDEYKYIAQYYPGTIWEDVQGPV